MTASAEGRDIGPPTSTNSLDDHASVHVVIDNGTCSGDYSTDADCDCSEPAQSIRDISRQSSPALRAPAQPAVNHKTTTYALYSKHGYENKCQISAVRKYLFFYRANLADNENAAIVPGEATERTPLLKSPDNSAEAQLGQMTAPGDGHVGWRHEAKTLAAYAAPLVVTCFLQYSIDVSSVLAAGRLGKIELGAVSLANMLAAITCFAAFQGVATSLDTLCSQAYGSGEKQLVGLYCQRMMLLLMSLSAPIAMLWFFSENIILNLVHDAESARLCSLYLRILIFAIPGYSAFETGKRFLQAQGRFRATTYIILVGAPINAILMWFLIRKLDLGFIGAPISVAITRTLLPVLLYVRFFDGSECWGGFSKRAFTNLGPMIRLAVPSMVMVEAEWLAFEILTVVSARFGVDYLAAQSILITLTTLSYQIPFPLSIAASTRVAGLIGARRADDAKVAAMVAVVASCMCTFLNFVVYVAFRVHLPHIFTDDENVAALVTSTLPLVGAMTFLDGVGVAAHGILRGIGKQSIGGPANLVAYYVVSLPLSLGFGIGLDWKIKGLWAGSTIGLVVVSMIEYTYLLTTDWQKAVIEAVARSAAG